MLKLKGKKINPEKSNRLIYAVAVGLILLAAGGLVYITLASKPKDKRELMLKTLSYLNETPGIISIQVSPESDGVEIIFDGTFRDDYEKMAHFAALRLSAELNHVDLALSKNRPGNPIYRIEITNGTITAEGRPQAENPFR